MSFAILVEMEIIYNTIIYLYEKNCRNVERISLSAREFVLNVTFRASADRIPMVKGGQIWRGF